MFYKLDFKSKYHQVKVKVSDISKVTFRADMDIMSPY